MPKQNTEARRTVTSSRKGEKVAQKRIAEAFRSRADKLDLSGLGLVALPTPFAALTSLKALNLNENRLAQLPVELRRFKKLERLDFRNNQIREIPNWIGELRNLRVLYFPNNFVQRLRKRLAGLIALNSCLLPEMN